MRRPIDLDRSTLADWVGKTTALLEPLADAIGRHVLSAEAIFADDTPISMLAPGTGKTQTARLWTYARDERPRGGTAPPAAWYRFSGDRKGQHPKDHLARFRGWMHADGYAGFEDLYRSGAIREVACMAHVRRKFVDIHRSQGSPIADEAISRIAQLYAVEQRQRQRLSRGYSTRTASLNRVRGRIDVLTTERHQLLARGLVACRFDELTIDTPRNRFVRAALERISRIVARPDVARRCRRLANDMKMMGVSGTVPTLREKSIDQFGRHDTEDQKMVAAAKLAFELAIPTETAGPQKMGREVRRSMIEPDHPQLSIGQQCALLSISRSSFYYTPKGETEQNLGLMRQIDGQFLETPFFGVRQMTWHLRNDGHLVNEKRIRRLMRLMGQMPIYQKPNTSKATKGHKTYPYLLRGLRVDRPNQVPLSGSCCA